MPQSTIQWVIGRAKRTPAFDRWLAIHRSLPVEIAPAESPIFWFRSNSSNQNVAISNLATIPGVELFLTDESGLLVRYGSSVPIDTIPEDLTWHSLKAYTSLWLGGLATEPRRWLHTAPATTFAPPESLQLRLARIDLVNASLLNIVAVHCNLSDLYSYVLETPRYRWRHLRFACDFPNRALVLGDPIPAVAGVRLRLVGKILVPIPYGWEPNVPPEMICDMYNVAETDYLLLNLDTDHEVISIQSFVDVTRASIRATFERAHQDPSTASIEGRAS